LAQSAKGRREDSQSGSGLASRFLQPVADGVGQAAGLGDWAENDIYPTRIEGTKPLKKAMSEFSLVVPGAPTEAIDARQRSPPVGEHHAHLGFSGCLVFHRIKQTMFEIIWIDLDEDQTTARRVMADTYARRWERLFGEFCPVHGRIELDGSGTGNGLDHWKCDGTRAIEDDFPRPHFGDGGFDTHIRGPAVENSVDASVEVVKDVSGGGGAGVAEAVSAGCGDGDSGGAEQRLRDRMRGDADADERSTGGDGVGDSFRTGKEQGQRARPEGFHQLFGDWRNVGDDLGQHGAVGDVDDQRIPVRALFRHEDLLDCLGRERACAQAVDGFRGKSDGSAFAEDLGGALDVCRVRRGEAFGVQERGHTLIMSGKR
jgi:hypothetical protein